MLSLVRVVGCPLHLHVHLHLYFAFCIFICIYGIG